MKYVPWYLKIFLKVILSRLPFGYSFWQTIGLFKHGHMDKIEYGIKVFERHLSFAGLNKQSIKGKTLLELGPGDSILSALIANSYGAKMILVDVGDYVKKDIIFYKNICDDLTKLGYEIPNISKCKDVYDILNLINTDYYTDGIESFRNILSGSIDLIFSQAVLEHVRKNEFNMLSSEIKRVLNKEGHSSHAIDLKDHLNFSLNNLRFPEKIWESNFFSSSGFYTNRLSISDIITVYEENGFNVRILNKLTWDKLPLPRSKLSKEFINRSTDDLLVSEFDLLLRHTR